jgi:hypothetical protein
MYPIFSTVWAGFIDAIIFHSKNIGHMFTSSCCLLLSFSNAGSVYGIHSQDPIHNGKKLLNALDVSSRVLVLGNYQAHFNDVHAVYNKFPFAEHGLRQNDVLRTDRQNWAAGQRVLFRRVRSCLGQLASVHNQLTQGTSAYLEVSAINILKYYNLYCPFCYFRSTTTECSLRSHGQILLYIYAYGCNVHVLKIYF